MVGWLGSVIFKRDFRFGSKITEKLLDWRKKADFVFKCFFPISHSLHASEHMTSLTTPIFDFHCYRSQAFVQFLLRLRRW